MSAVTPHGGAPLKTWVLLLVEDNPADAFYIEELLGQGEREHYEVVKAKSLEEATVTLRERRVDVVLLDLRLPDGAGLATVNSVRGVAEDVPIVVLTGTDDEQLALSCIDAGAQDYLCKAEVRALNLKRAIGYAITRHREAQVRELQAALDRYRELSSAASRTSVTASLAGSGSLRARYEAAFLRFVDEYLRLFEAYLSQLDAPRDKPRSQMEYLITALGDAGAGPRDLLDVHVAALDRSAPMHGQERSRWFVLEGRLLAVEMMGLLVDYYRVGARRYPPDEKQGRF